MLRPTLLVLVLFAAFCAAASAQQKTDREREGLHGPVKTVSGEAADRRVEPDGAQGESRSRPLDAVTYNEKGDEVSRRIYDDYGFLVGTQTYAYDAAGRLTESSMTVETNELMEREVFRYDAASRLVEKLTYGPQDTGGLTERLKETFSYDARGHVVEVALSSKGQRGGKTTYTYDKQGRVSELAFYMAGGKPAVAPVGPCFGVHRLAYRYDARGRVVEERAFEPDNSLKRTTRYTYDEKGNIAEESRADRYGSTTFNHAYEYDARGNWTKRETRVVNKSSLSFTLRGTPDSHERVRVTRRSITYF